MEEKTIMLLAVLLVGVAVVMGMKSDSGKQKSFAKKISTHLEEEGLKKKKQTLNRLPLPLKIPHD